ncbi:MAG: GtrA family protein [Oscillospiraceae bacterium]|nr:GtrA family protein [Oscillospiraceae bacterium]
MKNKSFLQAVKYAVFSVSAGIIQAVSFALLFNVLLGEKQALFWVCHITALVLSILWNFTLNRKYTFQSANNVPVAMLKVAGFYLVFTPVSAWLGQLAATAGWNGLLVEALTMIVNFVLEFLYFKFVVFREEKNA